MQLKYTFCDNKKDELLGNGAFAASQKLPAAGGRFVYYDISETAWHAVANDPAAIGGYSEDETDNMPAGTASTGATSSVALGTVLPITDVAERMIELPYGGAAVGSGSTLTETIGKALLQKLQYLYVDANGIQWFSTSGSNAILQVKGYDVGRNTVKVRVLYSAIVQVA